MPIYEYRCEACGHTLERMQKVSDAPLTDCPACAQPALRKLISAAAFRLKGGGWYETDFKKGNQKNLHDRGEKTADGAASDAAKPTGTGETGAAKSADSAGAAKPVASQATSKPAV